MRTSEQPQPTITPIESGSATTHVKYAVEYPLPGASQTHELVSVGNDRMIVITQQSDSILLKVQLNDQGRPVEARSFQIGTPRSGLHGIRPSEAYPGQVWITLQFDSQLIRLDPVATDVTAPPVIQQVIDVPQPGFGPHVAVENGDDLLVSLKDSADVLRISYTDPTDYDLYPVSRTPVFVDRHPVSGLIYASIDISSKVAIIDQAAGTVTERSVLEEGGTAVGLVVGNDHNIWVVLLGNSETGTGCFIKIDADNHFHVFNLPNTIGQTAGLLHLAFDPNFTDGSRIYLLSSSIAKPSGINAVFQVDMDPGNEKIKTVSTVVLPTQYSKAHRVLYTSKGLYVTELSVSGLAHIIARLYENEPFVDETSDYYGLFGMGTESASVNYVDPLSQG